MAIVKVTESNFEQEVLTGRGKSSRYISGAVWAATMPMFLESWMK